MCMPMNGLIPKIRRIEMMVVKNKLIMNMGILQCSHLVALLKIELYWHCQNYRAKPTAFCNV